MKLQQFVLFTLVVYLCLTLGLCKKKDCNKVDSGPACLITKGCSYYITTSCKGDSVSLCATEKQCKNQTTCAKDPTTSILYSFATSCIPQGFQVVADSSLCLCAEIPPAPPGVSHCANIKNNDVCRKNTKDCQLISGTNCNNFSYSFCRGKSYCSSERCAYEPKSGLYYLFKDGCIPGDWVRAQISKCQC